MATNSTQQETPKPKKPFRPPTEEKLLITEDKTEYELQVITPQSSDEPVEGGVETINAAEEHEEEELQKQKKSKS